MKKFFVYFALFIVAIFVMSCGGSESANNSTDNSSECSYGEYECIEGNSYWCGYDNGTNNLIWQIKKKCDNYCDSSTGKCAPSGGGNNTENDGDNSNDDENSSDVDYEYNDDDSGEDATECTSGQYKCEGSYSYCCSAGFWQYSEDCSTKGCNSSTGQCNTAECTSGQYKCEGASSYYCSNGFWEYSADCSETGCNPATGQCNAAECENGKQKCSDGTLYKCSGSKWGVERQCQYGCMGDGTPQCAVCKLGEQRCNGSIASTCGHGGAEWITDADCSSSQIYDGCYPGRGCGCNQGKRKCLTTSSGATYSGYCSNGTSYMGSGMEECTNGCNSSTGKCR